MIAQELFPERDCSSCTAAKKTEWGCSAYVEERDGVEHWVDAAVVPQMIDGKLDYACPRRPWLDDPRSMVYLYNAFGHYQNGFLLEEGAILDQPSKLMAAILIVSDQIAKCSEERRAVEAAAEKRRQRLAAESQFRGGPGNGR